MCGGGAEGGQGVHSERERESSRRELQLDSEGAAERRRTLLLSTQPDTVLGGREGGRKEEPGGALIGRAGAE